MRIFLFLGWTLMVGAFFAGVAETIAHVQPGAGGFYLSAFDVWYILWPGELIVTKIHVQNLLGPWAWDPVALGLLKLPGWALFGLPGGFLVWLGWPDKGVPSEEFDEVAESMFLYDDLAKRAREEGFTQDDPLYESSFDLFEELEDEDPPDDGLLHNPENPEEKTGS
ncbi:MAG: hypothetical protein ISR47_00370 [Rhodospirillales bacterium]|nr:hypothetical protein [Rhodospirillales bacterium]